LPRELAGAVEEEALRDAVDIEGGVDLAARVEEDGVGVFLFAEEAFDRLAVLVGDS